jgi:hypothetical protein
MGSGVPSPIRTTEPNSAFTGTDPDGSGTGHRMLQVGFFQELHLERAIAGDGGAHATVVHAPESAPARSEWIALGHPYPYAECL